MRQLGKRLGICLLLAAVCWTVGLVRDRAFLNRELIRLHVVANSDSEEDQAVKLRVRDAVLKSIRSDLEQVGDVNAAKAYLRENLPKIEKIANRTLEAAGVDAQAVASLQKEAFDIRNYDTFSLPAGVYESLRIVIGEGEGLVVRGLPGAVSQCYQRGLPRDCPNGGDERGAYREPDPGRGIRHPLFPAGCPG